MTADVSQSLDRAAIARAALAVLDAEGVDALSMRRLARDLGVGTMTLYGHVRSKRDLVDAAIDLAAEDFAVAPGEGGFREQMLRHLDAVRAWLGRHPALVRLRGEEASVRPSAFRISEPAMALLLDAGLPPDEAARTFRVLFTYVFGHALVAPRDPSPEERRALQAAVLSLPEDEFPALRAAGAGAGAALGGEAQFRHGAELLLDGIAARLR